MSSGAGIGAASPGVTTMLAMQGTLRFCQFRFFGVSAWTESRS